MKMYGLYYMLLIWGLDGMCTTLQLCHAISVCSAGTCLARGGGAIPTTNSLLFLLDLTPDDWLRPLEGVARPFMQAEEHTLRSIIRAAIGGDPLQHPFPAFLHGAKQLLQRLAELHSQYASDMPEHTLASLQHGELCWKVQFRSFRLLRCSELCFHL
jgi:hypothetical protein